MTEKELLTQLSKTHLINLDSLNKEEYFALEKSGLLNILTTIDDADFEHVKKDITYLKYEDVQTPDLLELPQPWGVLLEEQKLVQENNLKKYMADTPLSFALHFLKKPLNEENTEKFLTWIKDTYFPYASGIECIDEKVHVYITKEQNQYLNNDFEIFNLVFTVR